MEVCWWRTVITPTTDRVGLVFVQVLADYGVDAVAELDQLDAVLAPIMAEVASTKKKIETAIS